MSCGALLQVASAKDILGDASCSVLNIPSRVSCSVPAVSIVLPLVVTRIMISWVMLAVLF